MNRFIKYSYVNGPGKRFVVWLQGCEKECPGCFSTDTWDKNGGYEIEVNDLIDEIPNDIEGIAITGGEPLLQMEALKCFLFNYNVREPNKSIVLFSGFTYGVVRSADSHIVKYIHLLIAGPLYQNETNLAYKKWKGSNNQTLHYFSNKIDYNILNETPYEIHIAADGQSKLMTGFPDEAAIKKFKE